MYFEVPKAACTAIKELVNSIEEHVPDFRYLTSKGEVRRDMCIHDRINVALPSLVDLDDKTQRWVLESPDFLRMTVVRNPYTRLLSAWHKVMVCEPPYINLYREITGHLPELGRKSLISFEEFAEYIASKCDLHTCDPHWRLQVDHMFFRAMNFSYVGKMENMTQVLTTLQTHLNLQRPLSLNRSNRWPINSKPRIAEDLWDKVYTLYKEDFEALGYEKDSIPRPQEAEQHTIPEDKYINEIIERHMVIALLYKKCAELEQKVERVERFNLLTIVNRCIVPLRWLRRD
jgi:hypothetical protein